MHVSEAGAPAAGRPPGDGASGAVHALAVRVELAQHRLQVLGQARCERRLRSHRRTSR